MTRAALFLASPALFPDLSPVAVWIGVASLAVGLWFFWRANEYGSCETTLRADEAKDWLMNMQGVRVF